jgi:acyl-CoA reductase-like NAD-dependent aldehyde dehydrogenase
MLHLPILRAGVEYRSVEATVLPHVATGEPVAEVSQANRGLIARDLLAAPERRARLAAIPARELAAISRRAAALFATGELPFYGGVQSPADFVRQQSSTTGMPEALCRANLEKVRYVLAEVERVIGGLTRGLDLSLLDAGVGTQDGWTLSYLPQADALGCILPGNSPGVHSLWAPAVALKMPLVLKPGRLEPWTPHRVAQAFLAAGCPPEAFCLYSTDHAGATEILLHTGRSMLFGDASTLNPWRDDPRVQLHGPGWSKVLLGPDEVERWESHLDLMATSVAANGGRSCVNASGVWAPRRAREIAEGLAERLARVEARPLDDPEARLCAFPDARLARAISDTIDRLLVVPGAEDLTARVRGTGRVAEAGGCTFLLPTVIHCEDPDHPLVACEFLFPFATVVEAPAEEMARRIGPTLVATALTRDAAFRQALFASPHIDRLNLGSVPTSTVVWDQPHEGNLFDHLYRRRAVQDLAVANA